MALAKAVRPAVPLLLSLNAGYVDAAGFLALKGLFTAHVTGNFVTLGASLAVGTSGVVARVLAVPVFCAAVLAARLMGTLLSNRGAPAFEILIGIKLLLLIAGAALAIRLGPFLDGNGGPAIVTGMVLVAAMAVQNAVHHVHLGGAPPSTVLTGTTTQVMLDLGDRICARRGAESEPDSRLALMAATIVVFAIGCGGAAFLYMWVGTWCFLLPPVLAGLVLIVRLLGRRSAI